jgi:cytochrome c biogenesis factor
MLLVGVGATTFDRVDTVPVPAAATTHAAGVTVTNRGVTVEPGPRADADAVAASLTVDGREMSPSLVVYRANGGRLAETDLDPGFLYDTQVVLDDADDSGAVVVTVYRRPFVWLVWLGAMVVTIGTLGAAAASRRRPTGRHPADSATRGRSAMTPPILS